MDRGFRPLASCELHLALRRGRLLRELQGQRARQRPASRPTQRSVAGLPSASDCSRTCSPADRPRRRGHRNATWCASRDLLSARAGYHRRAIARHPSEGGLHSKGPTRKDRRRVASRLFACAGRAVIAPSRVDLTGSRAPRASVLAKSRVPGSQRNTSSERLEARLRPVGANAGRAGSGARLPARRSCPRARRQTHVHARSCGVLAACFAQLSRRSLPP